MCHVKPECSFLSPRVPWRTSLTGQVQANHSGIGLGTLGNEVRRGAKAIVIVALHAFKTLVLRIVIYRLSLWGCVRSRERTAGLVGGN